MFILLDGIDGSGKGTQTKLLVERLTKEGHGVEQISFPQYGQPSAAMVEAYLNGKFGTAEEVGPYRASIFYAVDRYEAAPRIHEWQKQKKIIVANRYVSSNMGHQGGKIKNSEERKKFFAWNYDLEYNIFNIPKPDLQIILHVPAGIAQTLVDKKDAREYLNGKKRDIHEDDLNHLRDAETAYLEIAHTFPDFTLVECAPDNKMLDVNQIHEKIWSAIESRLQNSRI